jgi:hypothetical protein
MHIGKKKAKSRIPHYVIFYRTVISNLRLRKFVEVFSPFFRCKVFVEWAPSEPAWPADRREELSSLFRKDEPD